MNWPRQYMAISLCPPNLTKISSSATETRSKPKFKLAAVTISNFTKSVILGIRDGVMTNINLRIKFRDAEKWHPRQHPPPSWILPKVGFWATVFLVSPTSILLPNLTQIFHRRPRNGPKTKSKMAAAPSWIFNKRYFVPSIAIAWSI